jgi:hypothetical protein
MRALAFILTFSFVLSGVSVAGVSDNRSVPNVGLFTYTGSPIVSDAPVLLAMATR